MDVLFVNMENDNLIFYFDIYFDNFQTKQNLFVHDFKSKIKSIFSVILIKIFGFHLFVLFRS